LKKLVDDAKLESHHQLLLKQEAECQEELETEFFDEEGLDEELFGTREKNSTKKNVKKIKIRDSQMFKPQMDEKILICKICSK
jgi:hypothetical protein